MFCVIIARHRYTTLYGQERPRLDRTQRVLETVVEPQRGRLFAAVSRMLFNVPSVYAKKLDDAWCDGVVYVFVWRELLTGSVEEWRQHFTWVSLYVSFHCAAVDRCRVPCLLLFISHSACQCA